MTIDHCYWKKKENFTAGVVFDLLLVIATLHAEFSQHSYIHPIRREGKKRVNGKKILISKKKELKPTQC